MGKTGIILCQFVALLVATATSCLAGSTNLAVSATILSANQCKFKNPSSRVLAFGDLDPLNASDVTLQTTLQFVCNGKDPSISYFIGDDDGQNESAPDANQMQHLSLPANYLPYTFSVSPATGTEKVKGTIITLTITGTVRSEDYRMAFAGGYSDQIILTVQP
jgi:hypothetical protein